MKISLHDNENSRVIIADVCELTKARTKLVRNKKCPACVLSARNSIVLGHGVLGVTKPCSKHFETLYTASGRVLVRK